MGVDYMKFFKKNIVINKGLQHATFNKIRYFQTIIKHAKIMDLNINPELLRIKWFAWS